MKTNEQVKYAVETLLPDLVAGKIKAIEFGNPKTTERCARISMLGTTVMLRPITVSGQQGSGLYLKQTDTKQIETVLHQWLADAQRQHVASELLSPR